MVQKILHYSEKFFYRLKIAKTITNGIIQGCKSCNSLWFPYTHMSYRALQADVSAFAFTVWLKSECNFWLDYDWQTGMSGTHLIFISLARKSCWHTGFCKWATDTFLIFFFFLLNLSRARPGAADNGKLQTFLIDLQSFDFREFFNAVFRIGLQRESRVSKVKKQWI